jgi:transcriptional regulator with XRE-family HTH domain
MFGMQLVVKPEPTFGARLRQSRLFRGLTAPAVGRILKVTPRTIYNWEAGQTFPDVHQLMQWSNVVAVPAAWFVEGVEMREPDPPADGSGSLVYAPWDLNPEPAGSGIRRAKLRRVA